MSQTVRKKRKSRAKRPADLKRMISILSSRGPPKYRELSANDKAAILKIYDEGKLPAAIQCIEREQYLRNYYDKYDLVGDKMEEYNKLGRVLGFKPKGKAKNKAYLGSGYYGGSKWTDYTRENSRCPDFRDVLERYEQNPNLPNISLPSRRPISQGMRDWLDFASSLKKGDEGEYNGKRYTRGMNGRIQKLGSGMYGEGCGYNYY